MNGHRPCLSRQKNDPSMSNLDVQQPDMVVSDDATPSIPGFRRQLPFIAFARLSNAATKIELRPRSNPLHPYPNSAMSLTDLAEGLDRHVKDHRQVP